MSTCPACGQDQADHSGHLFAIYHNDGTTERLLPAVALLRCQFCRAEFRADGTPYDEEQNWKNARRFGYCAACTGQGYFETSATGIVTCRYCNGTGRTKDRHAQPILDL